MIKTVFTKFVNLMGKFKTKEVLEKLKEPVKDGFMDAMEDKAKEELTKMIERYYDQEDSTQNECTSESYDAKEIGQEGATGVMEILEESYQDYRKKKTSEATTGATSDTTANKIGQDHDAATDEMEMMEESSMAKIMNNENAKEFLKDIATEIGQEGATGVMEILEESYQDYRKNKTSVATKATTGACEATKATTGATSDTTANKIGQDDSATDEMEMMEESSIKNETTLEEKIEKTFPSHYVTLAEASHYVN